MEKENANKKHSEEFRDIVERFPARINLILFSFLIFIVVALLVIGYFIKSPDIVATEINVTAEKPPISLVCKASGILKINRSHAQKQVFKGDYIAVIENTADDEDVLRIKKALHGFSIDSIADYKTYSFALNSNLGQIQDYYFEFLKSLYEVNRFYSDNKYDLESRSLDGQISKIGNSIRKRQEILKDKQTSIQISKRKKTEDSILVKNGALIRIELDNSSKILYKELEDKKQQENEVIRDRLNSLVLSEKKIQLSQEKDDLINKLKIKLLTDYQNLMSEISLWEQTFVFIAPFDGQLEYLRFVSNGQFVKQGDAIFSVLPQDNIFIGQALMPSTGAGKVKPYQEVIIKLNIFPYQEYGTLSGKVRSVSMMPLERTYLVEVELPKGLVSDNGTELNFSRDMDGSAEIITEDKRLISRVFDKIVYAFDRDVTAKKKNAENDERASN